MRAHRLQRLKLLTQGVALLGLGGEAACHDPPDTIHINAPYIAPEAGPPAVEPPHVNAPYVPPDAGAAPAPSASAAQAPLQVATSAAPSGTATPKPPFLVPHMNATAGPPKTVNAPPKPATPPPKP